MITTPTSSLPVKPSRLLQLPAELLLITLGQLDYSDLKRVRGVCKAFDTLVKDPKFDRVLFRHGVQALEPGQKIDLHPMLELADCLWVTSTEASQRERPFRNRNLYDCPACDEFATSPACADLLYTMFDNRDAMLDDDRVITNEAGITVRDVLQAAALFWRIIGLGDIDQTTSHTALDQLATTAAQPVGAPLALRLPDEVWLLILAKLEYRALKQAQRICKKVQRLIQLFRLGPVDGEIHDGMSFVLHPLIKGVDTHECTKWIAPVEVNIGSADAPYYVEYDGRKYPAAGEFATSLACRCLEISLDPGRDVEFGKKDDTHFVVEDYAGVRCDKVLEAIGKWLSKKAPNYATEEWKWEYKHKGRFVSNEMVFANCDGFEGWGDLVVLRRGKHRRQGPTVYLEALPLVYGDA
ncbi:hypothetical protein JCM8208_007372 [Rhodotorula glutinis]